MKYLRYFAVWFFLFNLTTCSPTTPPNAPADSQVLSPQASPVISLSEKANKEPLLEITLPRPYYFDECWLDAVTLYRWKTAKDATPPKHVRWILIDIQAHGNDFDATLDYIRSHPGDPNWTPWQEYHQNNNVGTSWLTPALDDSKYVFVLQGRGANGKMDEDFDLKRNTRYVRVRGSGEIGPLVTTYGQYFNAFESVGWSPIVIINVPEGEVLDFCWKAEPSLPGTSVATYRYGWDVQDLHNDDDWDTYHIPYNGYLTCCPPNSYEFGTHTFSLEVRDDSGRSTLAEVKINVEVDAYPFFGHVDIKPGNCDNVVNANSSGMLKCAVAGFEGFDVSEIDVSSITMNVSPITMEEIAPVRARITDIFTLPPDDGYCLCPDPIPDGYPDLVLWFDIPELMANLNLIENSGRRMVRIQGFFNDPSRGFLLKDCISFVGMPITGQDPLSDKSRGGSDQMENRGR